MYNYSRVIVLDKCDLTHIWCQITRTQKDQNARISEKPKNDTSWWISSSFAASIRYYVWSCRGEWRAPGFSRASTIWTSCFVDSRRRSFKKSGGYSTFSVPLAAASARGGAISLRMRDGTSGIWRTGEASYWDYYLVNITPHRDVFLPMIWVSVCDMNEYVLSSGISLSLYLGKTLMSITLIWTVLNQVRAPWIRTQHHMSSCEAIDQGMEGPTGPSAVQKVIVVCPTSLVGEFRE